MIQVSIVIIPCAVATLFQDRNNDKIVHYDIDC